VETKPKNSTACNGLCELHKCGARIGNKLKREGYAFGRINKQGKGMSKHQKTLIDLWWKDIKNTTISYWNRHSS
jgi:hypothetical protein